MAARAAVAHDKELNLYYERRIALGKHHMSVMNEIKFKLQFYENDTCNFLFPLCNRYRH